MKATVTYPGAPPRGARLPEGSYAGAACGARDTVPVDIDTGRKRVTYERHARVTESTIASLFARAGIHPNVIHAAAQDIAEVVATEGVATEVMYGHVLTLWERLSVQTHAVGVGLYDDRPEDRIERRVFHACEGCGTPELCTCGYGRGITRLTLAQKLWAGIPVRRRQLYRPRTPSMELQLVESIAPRCRFTPEPYVKIDATENARAALWRHAEREYAQRPLWEALRAQQERWGPAMPSRARHATPATPADVLPARNLPTGNVAHVLAAMAGASRGYELPSPHRPKWAVPVPDWCPV